MALVIGNANYPDASTPLSTAIKDVRTLAEELQRAGFAVDRKENAGKADMKSALDAFTGKIRPGMTALFCFSGYGIQVARQTYLIPVNAQLWAEADVRRDGISLDDVVAEIHRNGEKVVRAPADGYALLLASSPDAINATLYDRLTFNFLRDIAPVAGLVRNRLVMEVNPSFPATTVLEFITYAKANPGKINMASAGNGTPHHVAGELFKMMAGVNMLHVPYRGEAPALTDMISGQVQVMFGTVTASIGYIRAGKLRPLAVTTVTRSEALPDVPTVGDFVPGYEVSTWAGIGAPRGTPPEVIERHNREINAGLASPGIKARYADLAATAFASSPADFGKFIVEDTEKWAKVIKFAGIKPE